MSLNNTQSAIAKVCDEIKSLLLAKNEAYGDSAIDPVRIYSKSDPAEQINVRIDDKLSRILKGKAAGEDVDMDLIGYLVLKRVAEQNSPSNVAPVDLQPCQPKPPASIWHRTAEDTPKSRDKDQNGGVWVIDAGGSLSHPHWSNVAGGAYWARTRDIMQRCPLPESAPEPVADAFEEWWAARHPDHGLYGLKEASQWAWNAALAAKGGE